MTVHRGPTLPAHCASCGAEVIWITTRPAGRLMPIDTQASPAAEVPDRPGALLVDLDAGAAMVLSRQALAVVKEETPEEPLYRSHFATCPQAKEWRRA